MAGKPFKLHETRIVDAAKKEIFARDLSQVQGQREALVILWGAAFALKAIGSEFVKPADVIVDLPH